MHTSNGIDVVCDGSHPYGCDSSCRPTSEDVCVTVVHRTLGAPVNAGAAAGPAEAREFLPPGQDVVDHLLGQPSGEGVLLLG